jgi:hypothetical protein
MHDDNEIGHYVPLLSRIIILVAVITAIPVVLWTITAFVRSYVGPPKIPTFHQLAATASINAPAGNNTGQNASQGAADRMMADAAKQAKLADPSSSAVEAKATVTDARNDTAAPKGPFLGDHTPESAANTPAGTPPPSAPPPSAPPPSAPKMADTSTKVSMELKPAEMPAPPATATPDAATPSVALAAQQPASELPPDAMPAAAPLPGPIPLPRHRPHGIAEAQTAPMTQIASASPSNVPMPRPRPRPDTAGPGAPAETASGGPLDFLQNLFGGK